MPNDSSPRGAPGLSRRQFLKTFGATALATTTARAETAADELARLNGETAHGPEAVPVKLTINGQTRTFSLEPRVTLLEALRHSAGLTGAKEVCDRATCGACTVWIDGVPTYACMKLAIDAQGQEITTIEGLAPDGKLTAVQHAFIECDGLQCGYCTPGFVMSVTALLKKTPRPTEAEVRTACSGNLCRCGTYPRVFQAALKAAGVTPPLANP